MNAGPGIEYAFARLSARLAARPDERLWRRLRSARSLAAAIDVVRASPAAAYVAGVAAEATPDDVDLAFRQYLRTRIREAASWAPERWRSAIEFTEVLLDLPAVQHLLADEAPAAWLSRDLKLGEYALPDPLARRARLAQSALSPLAAGGELRQAPSVPATGRRKPPTHPLLQAWLAHWQRLWPSCGADDRDGLQRLLGAVVDHAATFGALPVDAATPARQRLAERARRFVHQAAVQPAALFAGLLLVALDVERMRGEFMLRAARRAPFNAESVA